MKQVFATVDADKNGALNLREFKQFVIDKQAEETYRTLALEMRRRRDEDYEMCKVADKQYFPTKFNSMLNYLFKKSKHSELVKSITNPRSSKKDGSRIDVKNFLQAFTYSDGFLNVNEHKSLKDF